ncbi:MAG: hypothetical protein ACRER9_09000, partial [Gammaproteobacteria bacterium]
MQMPTTERKHNPPDLASSKPRAQGDKSRLHAFSREQLLACGRGELFGVDNARLPAPPLLMFDRITHIADTGGAYNKGEIRAELDIQPDLW